MDRIEKRKLIKELELRIKIEKGNRNRRIRELGRIDLWYKPKYLNEAEKEQIIGLHDFMILNPNLSNEQLSEILISNKKKYAFLIECENRYSNFYEDVRKSVGLLFDRIAYDKLKDEALKRPLV